MILTGNQEEQCTLKTEQCKIYFELTTKSRLCRNTQQKLKTK